MNRIKLTLGSLLICAIAACSVETPEVDQVPVGPGGAGGLVDPRQPPVPIGAGAYPLCKLDTRQVVETQGRFLEIVTSRGRLFEFENGNPVQPPTGFLPTAYPTPYSPLPYGVNGVTGFAAADLTTIPLYAAGPCLGRPPGTCVFETHAFVLLPEGRLLEYVTAAGRQWVFEANQMTGAGVELAAIPRYSEICALRGLSGGFCRFDTRTFMKVGAGVVESITAYGRRFQIDLDGARLPDSGIDLTQIPQYANGPCRGRAPGTCMFETRTFEVASGQLIESITALGTVFRYLATGGEVPGNGLPVMTTPHWANGPCR